MLAGLHSNPIFYLFCDFLMLLQIPTKKIVGSPEDEQSMITASVVSQDKLGQPACSEYLYNVY